MRVPVSDKQAIVCFPKFETIGIGFQHETEWNRNLPWDMNAIALFEWIKPNKGDESIPDELCIRAIVLLKRAIRQAGYKPKREGYD